MSNPTSWNDFELNLNINSNFGEIYCQGRILVTNLTCQIKTVLADLLLSSLESKLSCLLLEFTSFILVKS